MFQINGDLDICIQALGLGLDLPLIKSTLIKDQSRGKSRLCLRRDMKIIWKLSGAALNPTYVKS